MHAARALAAALGIACLCACSREGETRETPSAKSAETAAEAPREGPPTAKWETVDAMRESMAAYHGPADGGGRAWLVGPAHVRSAE